jgi:hypothetical protein
LKFTPDANLFSPASSFFFTVQAGIGDSDEALAMRSQQPASTLAARMPIW